MSARYDYQADGEAGYTGSYTDSNTAFDMGGMSADAYEQAHMAPFTPGANQGAPWWQGIIQYGVTRAIDNRYAPVNVAGNVATGSFAGANGRTYYQAPQGNRGQGPQGGDTGMNPLILLAGIAAAALAFAG